MGGAETGRTRKVAQKTRPSIIIIRRGLAFLLCVSFLLFLLGGAGRWGGEVDEPQRKKISKKKRHTGSFGGMN